MTPEKMGKKDIQLGKKVKEARNLRRFSQVQLAEKLGLSSQQIQKYEKGSKSISSVSLLQISRILDVPLEFFFQKTANTNEAKYKHLSPKAVCLLDVYSQLPLRRQSLAFEIMKTMLEKA